jgi:N-acetylneuraminic acid mutarotase
MALLPQSRSNHVAVAVGSAIYVIGGAVGRDSDQNLARRVYKFSIALGTWNEVAPIYARGKKWPRRLCSGPGSLISVCDGFNDDSCDSDLKLKRLDLEVSFKFGW